MHRVGYSQFRDFKQCPLRHHLKYVEKRPEFVSPERQARMEFGTLVQRTVEHFYREQLWRRQDPLAHLQQSLRAATLTLAPGYHSTSRGKDAIGRSFRSQTVCSCERSEGAVDCPVLRRDSDRCRGRDLRGSVRGRGSKWRIRSLNHLRARGPLLPGILQTMRHERLVGPLTAVEERVSLIVAGVSIEGRVDLLVREASGRTTLIDGKAGSTVDLDQLRVYATALATTGWGFPQRIGTWSYRKASVTWATFTFARAGKFVQGLAGVLERWAHGTDRTAQVGSHCRACGYRIGCDAYQTAERARQAQGPAVPDGGGFISLEGFV